jgi:hypothetical protein
MDRGSWDEGLWVVLAPSVTYDVFVRAAAVTVPFKDPRGHGTFVAGCAVGAALLPPTARGAPGQYVNPVTGAVRNYTLDGRTGSAPGTYGRTCGAGRSCRVVAAGLS